MPLISPSGQVVHVELPALLNVPANQSMQDDAAAALYFPATH